MNRGQLIELINTVEDLDGKLDLLTTIEIVTASDQIYQDCQDLRNDLCEFGHIVTQDRRTLAEFI